MAQPNFRQLEMFQLLMKTRSLTETARLLRVSQPAVSQSLRDLEAQLGLTLFTRGGGRIRPTDEAIQVQADVERVLALMNALSFRAAELKDALAGQITVAAIPIISAHLAPRAIAAFKIERPRARFVLRSLNTIEVVQQVKQQQADLGFAFAPVDEMMAGAEPLFETALVCIMPSDHRLASSSRVQAADLEGENVIALTPEVPPGLLLREALDRHSSRGFAAIETNSAAAALALVRAGAGVAVVDPLPLLGGPLEGLAVRPFEPCVPITLGVLFSRNRPLPRIAMQFVREMRKVLAASAVELTAAGVPSSAL